MANSATLDVDGKEVNVTNLRKVFYPKTGFTEGQVIGLESFPKTSGSKGLHLG